MTVPAGPEWGARYELVAPSGAIIVFNDTTSPYFVGALSAESSGLDSPEIRDSFSELVEADGASPGNSFRGRRPIILNGTVLATGALQRNERMENIKAAANALRADGNLFWTPEGGQNVFCKVRLQQPLRFTKGFVKDFQIPLVANDPRIYSVTLTNVEVTATTEGTSGFVFPLGFDLDFGEVSYAGQAIVTNEGTADSPPVIRIYGPGINPTLVNVTTGKTVNLTYNLGAGEFLELDFATHQVLLNGNVNRYSAYDFDSSEWWMLQPGTNDVRMTFASFTPGAKMELLYRSAWL